MSAPKQARATAKLMLDLSMEAGQLSETKVRDVLVWFEQKTPAHAAAVLREYRRLVVREHGRGHAKIEFAGALGDDAEVQIIRSVPGRIISSAATSPRPRVSPTSG